MKVVLLQPPIEDFYETDLRLQPLGLCYLKAAVEARVPGAEVVVKDFHRGSSRRTIALPEELQYLRKFYAAPDQSPFCSFYNYFHFGADYHEIACAVAEEKPDLVGISSLFSPYYREVLQTARAIKEMIPAPIVLGGSHATAMPELMLADPAVDFVIRGEGEQALAELVKALAEERSIEQISGVSFRSSGGGFKISGLAPTCPLDELPSPDFSDLNPDHYLYQGRRLSFIITSRSCPHRCSFCSVHQVFGRDYRRRSPESVVQEILLRYADGIRVFDFEDDNLTFYRDEMKRLCCLLIDAFPERDVQFLAMNGISYLSLDPELLGLMKAAGFTELNVSLVSSDESVLQTAQRPHTVKRYREVVEHAFSLGFRITSYQILGLPFEPVESMIQTMVLGADLPVLLGASPFYLTPRSPVAAHFPEPLASDVFKSRLTAMGAGRSGASTAEIFSLFVTSRIINFLKTAPMTEEVTLDELLSSPLLNGDKRGAAGIDLLNRLHRKEGLFAWHKGKRAALAEFRMETFHRVWDNLRTIRTTSGGVIRLR